jgi:hypothetical protein
MDNYAFIATRIPNIDGPPTYLDLKVLDISNPKDITYVSTVNTGENYNGGAPNDHTNDLVFLNDFAYGLKILNFSNPLNVSFVGNYTDDGFYNDVQLVENNQAFIADDYFGLKVIDYSNLKNLFQTSSFELDNRVLRVIVENTRIYLATIGGGVRILNMKIETTNSASITFWLISNMILVPIIFYQVKKKKKERKRGFT